MNSEFLHRSSGNIEHSSLFHSSHSSLILTLTSFNVVEAENKLGEDTSQGITIHEVPNGWNPLTATNEELIYYCYPPRPTDPQQIEGWKKIVTGGQWVKPKVTKSNRHFKFTKIRSSSSPSSNWAGVINTSVSTRVTGKWTVPTPTSGNNACASAWIGLGGGVKTSSTVVQAGTDSNYNGSASYDIWWEVYNPSSDQQASLKGTFTKLKGGDTIYSDISYNTSNGNASFYIYDMTAGQVTSFSKSVSYFGNLTSSAEWVIERPWNGSSFYVLPAFSNSSFWESQYGSTSSLSYVTNSSGYTWYDNMVRQAGVDNTPLATPSTLGSTGNFTVNFVRGQ